MRIGFLGLGVMGVPMARNLARKFPLTVWNRSPSKYSLLKESGVIIGSTPANALQQSDIVFMMLFNAPAVQSILATGDFQRALPGKFLVNTSSILAQSSKAFDEQVRRAGGTFVEMLVSGSKVPAEQGQLVGMMAGDRSVTEQIRPFVEPITRTAAYCGPAIDSA